MRAVQWVGFMGEPKVEKNRRHERINVRIPVRIIPKQESHRTYEGEILNLSEGGAYIAADVPFEVGAELSLEFRFAEVRKFSSRVVDERSAPPKPSNVSSVESQHPITAGIVRWQEEKSKLGFGVEFTPVQIDDREYLQKVLSYFLQLEKAGVTF